MENRAALSIDAPDELAQADEVLVGRVLFMYNVTYYNVMDVYIYIYIEREREREIERERERYSMGILLTYTYTCMYIYIYIYIIPPP